MAAETVALVSSIFGCLTVVFALVSPCVREPLSEEYNLFRNRRSKLEDLKKIRNSLEKLRSDVEGQSKVKVVRKSCQILTWLKEGEKVIKEVTDCKFEGRLSENSCGLLNFWSQYKAAKEIEEKITQLNKVQEEGKEFINGGESDVVGDIKDTTTLLGKTASIVEDIKKFVAGKEVGTIRVYGMAGSGKTAVVSEVNNFILKEYSNSSTASGDENGENHMVITERVGLGFEKVIWVTVDNGSGQASIENLQNKIAGKLQFELKKVTGSRVEALEGELRKLRFLIILDDMWTEFSLEEIGIPRPSKDDGCESKVIIVSRSLPVCSAIKIDKNFETKLLSEAEALELFEREAGVKLSDMEDPGATAKDMVDQCDGLPLEIVLLAKTLKGLKVDDSWKAAWDKLKDSKLPLESMKEKAFTRLKYSYAMLRKEAQPCFLYCALYPCGHYIERKELVENWFWEALLDSGERIGRIEDMIQAREILEELYGAYLLEKVSQGGKQFIKMPKLVWHMAVHLTKTSPRFLIKAGEEVNSLKLQGEYWSEVERASLMRNQIKVLTEVPEFSKLSTLLLQHNSIFYLHDNFLSSMPNIRVLDLSHNPIQSLPNSAFINLRKLRALVLKNCCNLKYLPSLANSKELLVLDLSDTSITQLPDGMTKLTKLIRLNLSRTKVGELQAALVNALMDLEELLIATNDSGSLWGSTERERSKELGALRNLAVLHINFLDAEVFSRYVNSKKHCLSKFKFCVGGCKEDLPENSIVFIDTNFFVKEKPVSLPEDTSELHVVSNKDLPWLQVTCNLKNLKVINVYGCESLVFLFKIGMFENLPNIETILIEKCQKMEGLIESKVYTDDEQVAARLIYLKTIHISDCENVVYLLKNEMLRYFPNLVEISVKQCKSMEVVIESKEPSVCPAILPRLQNLVLADLPQLKSIYNGEMISNFQRSIWKCPALKMPFVTSLPELLSKPSLKATRINQTGSFSGTKQIKRNRSFESMQEAEAAPNADGDYERASHYSTLFTSPHKAKNIRGNH